VRLVSFVAVAGLVVETIGIMQMTAWVGGWVTIALLVAGVMIGVQLSRFTGKRALREVERAVGEGRAPGDEIVGGLLVFLAAVLFMVPGFVTDAAAILLLLPPIRRVVARRLAPRLLKSEGAGFGSFGFGFGGPGAHGAPLDDGIIDVEAEPVAGSPPAALPPRSGSKPPG
jgi:UPF0716 protein FxsA